MARNKFYFTRVLTRPTLVFFHLMTAAFRAPLKCTFLLTWLLVCDRFRSEQHLQGGRAAADTLWFAGVRSAGTLRCRSHLRTGNRLMESVSLHMRTAHSVHREHFPVVSPLTHVTGIAAIFLTRKYDVMVSSYLNLLVSLLHLYFVSCFWSL